MNSTTKLAAKHLRPAAASVGAPFDFLAGTTKVGIVSLLALQNLGVLFGVHIVSKSEGPASRAKMFEGRSHGSGPLEQERSAHVFSGRLCARVERVEINYEEGAGSLWCIAAFPVPRMST